MMIPRIIAFNARAVLLLCLLFLSGCASVISNQSLSLVDPRISFTELRQDTDRHIGKYFLLGGEIVGVRNSNEGGDLELAQFATDESGEITNTTNSGGRFIARKSDFLEPAVYRTGFLVTLVGEVQGKETMPLGDIDYTYPVLAIREIHLWKPEELPKPPTFHFGFGLGTTIH